MDNRSSTTYLTVAAVTVAAGLAAYAVYFDYKRRNDVEFRKQLKREKKRVQKSVSQSKETVAASATHEVSPEALREALLQIRKEDGPTTPEEKETYFMSQVSVGEQLAAQGPDFALPAAMAFFRALRMYPSPVELIVIYQKTIPEHVFKLVMDMTNLDVVFRIEAYYDFFPPKRTNVSVVTRQSNGETRQVLVVDKDVAAGEVIYKEHPVVTALDGDLQEKGTYCGQCLRPIEQEISLQLKDSSTSFPQTYCSKACLLAAKNQSHTLLFTSDSPLPAEIPSAPIPPAAHEARRKAQTEFAEYIKKEGRATPLLVARFIARQIAVETQKLVDATAAAATTKATPPESDFTDAESATEKYALADHIERFRFLETVKNEEEIQLLINVLSSALPGLEEFMTADRHAVISGKMAYNAFGVCYGGGRDDKPEPTTRPEEHEKTRTPYGTQRQIGSALYTVSSYLTHSCQPSARPSFSSGTSEMSVIANRDLKKGDELTIAFVDVIQHPDESVVECRRRRRFELARGWRFACTCERCAEEGKSMTLEEKGGATDEQVRDESKVETSLSRYQTKAGDTEDVE